MSLSMDLETNVNAGHKDIQLSVPSPDPANVSTNTNQGCYARCGEEPQKKYDSFDYLHPYSDVYKEWIGKKYSSMEWYRWAMMALIGFVVGIVGFSVQVLIGLISDFRWDQTLMHLKDGLFYAWLVSVGWSLLFLVPGILLIIWRPSAGGSGLPELMSYLNGTIVHHIFRARTMIVKFLSCVLSVGSGMPVGPEGPMIHMGSLIGAGLSQFKNDKSNFRPKKLERFRNSEDKRNFISAGAAAGVSSAFRAPVGGLLFCMEEVSSFWNMKLSWQIFFCCMVSTITTNFFMSLFNGLYHETITGLFTEENAVLFQVESELSTHILTFIPAALLGVIGGLLGAVFVTLNTQITKWRRTILSKCETNCCKILIRLLEPVCIMLITATVSVLWPAIFDCTKFVCNVDNSKITAEANPECLRVAMEDHRPPRTESSVQTYTCPVGTEWSVDENELMVNNKTYNDAATLLFVTGEEAIHHLFSAGTHKQFDLLVLFTVLVFYFFLACWAAGTSISSGLVVPMLLIGGLYGRFVGEAMVLLFGVHTPQQDPLWAWIDPGVMAIIGAASFFAGVSRLTLSLTVIMVEITNDLTFLLPIMSAVMISKAIGDCFTHPLYHSLIEVKEIPFLDSEPVAAHHTESKTPVNFHLGHASDVMDDSFDVVKLQEDVKSIFRLLSSSEQSGFPVVDETDKGKVLDGIITRVELCMLLKHPEIFEDKREDGVNVGKPMRNLDYHEVNVDKLPPDIYQVIKRLQESGKYENKVLDLNPYVNRSCVTVSETFSLHRTYVIFRLLGLRHLPVVDKHNEVKGIITREKLSEFCHKDEVNPRNNPKGSYDNQVDIENGSTDNPVHDENGSSDS